MLRFIKQSLKKDLQDYRKVVRQSLLLFAAQLILIVVGFGIKYIQTHELGEVNYGQYAFFISITGFVVLFFRFGYFVSIQVLLAENEDPGKSRKLLGAGFIIAASIGILFAVFIWGSSFWIDDIFKTDMGQTFRLFAPFCFVLPFYYLVQAASSGTNKISWSAIYQTGSKIIFLLALIIWLNSNSLSINATIVMNLVSTMAILILLYVLMKPDFSNVRGCLAEIKSKQQSYGKHYYLGAIANQTTYKMDELFISFFINTTSLGFYTLANIVCSPMVFMSQALSQSMFKKYAGLDKIPKKIFTYNTLWLVACVLFLWLSSRFIVQFIFGEGFEIVSWYILLLCFAFFFQGLSQPYSFLAAKSKGKEIRNVSWAEAGFNIAGNIILIPRYGVEGAICSSIIAKFINFFLFSIYYKRYLNKV